jgi:hypothetical protein
MPTLIYTPIPSVSPNVSLSQDYIPYYTDVETVKHVHWLRAHAQKDRCHKEVTLVIYEMQWTVRYLLHKSHGWQDGASACNTAPGAQAYALQQCEM